MPLLVLLLLLLLLLLRYHSHNFLPLFATRSGRGGGGVPSLGREGRERHARRHQPAGLPVRRENHLVVRLPQVGSGPR